MASIINADVTNGVVITSDTSGEINLQANGVTKAKVTANGLQDANGNSLRGGMYRNLIINGDMQIAQRGTSVSSISSSNDYYTCDRWRLGVVTAGTWTQTQDTDVPTGQGFANSFKVACTTANASLSANSTLFIQQRIEGQNLQYLKYGTSNAENITVSLWVKSNKTGTYVVEGYDVDNTKHIGKTFTISSANIWEKKTLTFSGNTLNNFDNDNNLSLQIVFWLAGGTNSTSGTLPSSWSTVSTANRAAGQTVNLADSTSNYINITGCQLEIGDGASDFEFLPYDVQLARCMRYYEKSYNYSNVPGSVSSADREEHYTVSDGSSNTVVGTSFKVTKRTTPTMKYYIDSTGNLGQWLYARSGVGYTASNITNYTTTESLWRAYMGVGASYAPIICKGHWVAESEL